MASGSSIGDAFTLAKQGWYVGVACILMTTQPFITMLSKNEKGGYDYLAISTTLVSEVAKFCISFTFYLLLPPSAKSHKMLKRREVLLFAVPAFVYFVNNNLVFVILFYVNSTAFQILSSLKTVFTGIFFRLILKRLLSDVQWISIMMLACGTAVSQFPVCSTCEWQYDQYLLAQQTNASLPGGSSSSSRSLSSSSSSIISAAGSISGAWLGSIAALVTCVLSAFGGVYSELLLKKDGNLHSIHLQNALLYSWGVLFNGLALILKDRHAIVEKGGLFSGYSFIVILLIINNSLVGLAISAILKFANNLVRVFAHTLSMLLTMLLETLFVGVPMSPQLATSIMIVTGSAYLYNVHPSPKPITRSLSANNPLDSTREEEEEASSKASRIRHGDQSAETAPMLS